MFVDQKLEPKPSLAIPEDLRPRGDLLLPKITPELLGDLQKEGWATIGIMVAFIDSYGRVMLLEHNGRDKNRPRALGPLGETSQEAGPIIEQPLQTLYRGIQEELGTERPESLGLSMYAGGGWIINQWPRGDAFPHQYACAISFPVFVPDTTKTYLNSFSHGTQEVSGVGFLPDETILTMDDSLLRPGVKEWLAQLGQAGLLRPAEYGPLVPVDFSALYEWSRLDINLQVS